MDRTEDRKKILELLYEMDIKGEEDTKNLPRYIERDNISTKSYVNNLINKYLSHKEKIISMISKGSDKWNIDRISKVDLAIIKIATTEIMYISKIPDKVAINEGILLSKEYSTADEYKFVNGVLKYVLTEKIKQKKIKEKKNRNTQNRKKRKKKSIETKQQPVLSAEKIGENKKNNKKNNKNGKNIESIKSRKNGVNKENKQNDDTGKRTKNEKNSEN